MGIEVIPLDVVDNASIQNAVEVVKAKTGGSLDMLVNNSGGGILRYLPFVINTQLTRP